MTLQADVRPSRIESAVSVATFGLAYDELTSNNYDIISLADNVDLCLAQGRDSPITKNGNYVRNGQVYYKGNEGIFVSTSPLITDASLRVQAVEANRQGRYLSTQDNALYNQILAQVELDKSRDPQDRRAMLLPSDKPFALSPSENPELFAMALGKNGKAYLDMVGQESVTFYPIDQEKLKGYVGTVPTQLWFRRRDDDNWSELIGDDRYLGGDYRVRGVRKVLAGEASSREVSSPNGKSELAYDPEKLSQYRLILQEVRKGDRAPSELEQVLAFINGLPVKA